MILAFQLMLLMAIFFAFFMALAGDTEIGLRATAICLAAIAAFAFTLWMA